MALTLPGRDASRDPSRAPIIDSQLRALSIVVVLGTIMSIFDTTIVNVAIDTLGRKFHTTLATIQWVSTAYLLSLAIVIPLTGWAIERFGAKRMYLISLTLFLIGSALCGRAWSAGSLIAFRVLQGLGGGMILPIGQTILARAAGPQRIGRVMSVVGIPMLLGPVLGPALGGLIIDNFSWRWIFYVNIPIGLLALVMAGRTLKSDATGTAGKLDIVGLSLLSPGLAGIVYGLSEAGSSGGFGESRVLVGLTVGILLMVAFVWHALHTAAPLIELRLFRNRGFSAAGVTSFILGGTVFGAMFLLPLILPGGPRAERAVGRLADGSAGARAMIAMPIAGRITDRVGAYRIVPFGVTILVIGTLAYTQVTTSSSELLLAGALFIRGLGLGMSMMPSMSRRVSDPGAAPGTARDDDHQHPATGWRVARYGGAGGHPPASDRGVGPTEREAVAACSEAVRRFRRPHVHRFPTPLPTRSGGRSGCHLSASCRRSGCHGFAPVVPFRAARMLSPRRVAFLSRSDRRHP